MWKYLRHIAAVIVIVFCWSISQTTARSSNGIITGHYQTRSANNVPQQQHQQQQQYQQQQQQQYANTITSETESSTTTTTTTNNNNNNNNNNSNNNDNFDNTGSPNIWQDISMVYRLYQQCTGENLSICLKVKLLTGLEKMLRSVKTLKLIDGVQFIKSSDNDTDSNNIHHQDSNITKHKGFMINEKDIEAILPRSFEAKEKTLNNLLLKRLSSFLRDHTLQIKFPNLNDLPTDQHDSFEGRKKDKKGGGGGGGAYMMIPLLLGGTIVPIAYGALALLAGKALIVAKLALVLSMIIGLKKLLGGGGKESHEVVVSSGGHSDWGRNLDIAYAGWKPHKDKML